MADEKKQFQCPRCERTAEAKKSPFGWRKLPTGETICGACFKKAYRAVQVTMPIRGVYAPGLAQGSEELAARTQEFRDSLLTVWDHCIALANWAITECVRNEPPRLPGDPLAKINPELYKAFGNSVLRPFWNNSTTSANSILKMALAKYLEMRFAMYVTHKMSAPTFRTMPYFVPSQSWSLRLENPDKEDSRTIVLSVPLNGQRVELQLLNGRKSRYHAKRLAEIIAGNALVGELQIDGVDGSPSLRRNGIRFRRPGGGETRFVWPVVRITTYIPKIQDDIPRERRALNVFTGENCMLVTQLENDTGEPWTYSMFCFASSPSRRTSSSRLTCGMAYRSPSFVTTNAGMMASVSGILILIVVP